MAFVLDVPISMPNNRSLVIGSAPLSRFCGQDVPSGIFVPQSVFVFVLAALNGMI
jgi:hypothetical protein